MYVVVWFIVSMGLLGCCIICYTEACREEEEDHRHAAARALELSWALEATARAVNPKLGYFPYSAAAVEGDQRPMCAICREAFVQGATCSEVPGCRHMFHRDCIDLWMRTKATCPLCRAAIVPGSEPPSAAEDMV